MTPQGYGYGAGDSLPLTDGLADAPAVSDADADADADSDADPDGATLSVPDGSALPDPDGATDSDVEGSGVGVASGTRLLGNPAKASTTISTKIATTAADHGLASRSLAGGRERR